MRRHLLGGLAAAMVLAVLAPPAAGSAAPPRAPESAPAPAWHACPPPGPDSFRDPRQECATLRVPLDYRHPDGRRIDVEISRITTSTPATRRGILLINPGGPGAPGLDMPSILAQLLPGAVTDRYDLVGFDPRGVANSTPVSCGIAANAPQDLLLPFPAPDGSIDRNIAFARRTAAGCAAAAGDLLPHITTANTARDMDQIRAALHEPKLSYLGYSYGTYLGAVYTSLFPARSDRIVLDSAVNPGLVWYDQWRLFSIGFAARFPDFTTWVAARDDTYHLGTTPAAVSRRYDEMTARLDRTPVPYQGLEVTGNLIRLATFSSLYSDRSFPELATIWQAFAQPVPAASGLAALRARLTRPARVAAGVPADNSQAVLYAVACDDAAWPRDLDVYRRNVAADRALFPRTAGFPANLWPCTFWPTRPVEPPVAVTGRGPRDVLVLQNLRDPATPWIGGFGLRTALAGRAAMVSVDQGGHGVYPVTNAPCAAEIATAFLVSGALPDRDRSCPGQRPGDVTAQPLLTRLAPLGG